MKHYVQLIKDSYPFKKGTEFLVTGGDDGMWSRYAFHSGTVIVGGERERISVEESCCESIQPKNFTGKVIVEEEWLHPKPMTDAEFWEEWSNSPG